MKILWFTNVPLPEACVLMKERPDSFGGWLVKASEVLSEQFGIELSVAFAQRNVTDVIELNGVKIKYYLFPLISEKNVKSERNIYLTKILDVAKPNIVHIFGTEYTHSLAIVNACLRHCINPVISVQGLVSVIARHYMVGLPTYIQNMSTFRDYLKRENIKQQQRQFIKAGKYEIEALQKVTHIIGRTTWDKACITQINPNAKYHYCNETLRDAFYKHIWNLNKCEKHSIFVSQGSYPIKGLHYMLEAMPLILKKFPDSKLYIGGHNIIKAETLIDKLKLTSYGKYIIKLIKQFKLENCVMFTGILDEKKMCEQYLRSNVYVCCSTIENSPNSLGEAMILGVPCIASDVGGVADMIRHKDEGFVYQADAPYMLAHYVCEIFSNAEIGVTMSEKARHHAIVTHDVKNNVIRLLEIYKEIESC